MRFDNAVFERGSRVYPQPVAVACGAICAENSPQGRVGAVLKAAEVLTRYVAAASLSSFAARADVDVGPPGSFKQFTGNLSFGHFLSVVQGVAGIQCYHPLRAALQPFRTSKKQPAVANDALVSLLTIRNREGHDLAVLSDAKAKFVLAQDQPDRHLCSAIESLEDLLSFPLFLIQETHLRKRRLVASRLLLMSDSMNPKPGEAELDEGLMYDNSPYLGVGDGAMPLYPFLLWDLSPNQGSYQLYMLHSVDTDRVDLVTVTGDSRQHNGDIVRRIEARLRGKSVPVEPAKLRDGISFAEQWRDICDATANSKAPQPVPWHEFDPDTVRWYARRLTGDSDVSDAHALITDQLLDGRRHVTPDEARQLVLLFGRQREVRTLLGRDLIDLRAKVGADSRLDARAECAENLLECLKTAIQFIGEYIGLGAMSAEGLRAVSGSADYISVREGLLNLLIHQDYEDKRASGQVDMTPDRVQFFNPGRSLVDPAALVEGGKSQSRNPLISRALKLIGFAELAGSGLTEVARAFRNANRRPPTFMSDDEANTFTLTLDRRELPVITDDFWWERLGIKISPQEARALLLAAEPGGTDTAAIASATGVRLDDARRIEDELVRQSLVVRSDGRIYLQEHLRDLADEALKSSEPPIAPPSSTQTAGLASGPTPEVSRMTEQRTTFDVSKESLGEILQGVKRGKVQLPDFQRGWVWDDAHIRSLLASVSLSFPIGTVMMLQTGNPEVSFNPRPIEGVSQDPMLEPERLILDGQQRLTSLYHALLSNQPVKTFDTKGKEIRRWYYLNIRKALDPDADREEETIVSLPEDKKVTTFRGIVEQDYSTIDLECAAEMLPVSVVFDVSALTSWQLNYLNSSPSQLQERLGRWNALMQTVIQPMLGYQIPVIVLQKDTPKEAVCLVFERVNTGGVALTVFELVTATYAASNFPLREDWSRRADHLKRYNIENTDFLQAVTLLATYAKRLDAERAESDSTTAIGCKRRDILRLSLEDYKRWADPVMEGFQRAFRLLQSQNIFAARDLPYRTQVVPLAAILTALGARGETDGVRTKLVRWYWCGVLGELYGGSVETRFAKDLPQVLRWIDGGPEPDTITDANFAPARLLSLRTRGSAAYKGLYALLMRDGCLDFRTGEPITAQTYYSDRIDVHHIFPQSWCAKRGIDVTHADSIVNKTALSAATNRAVGGNAPSVYLTRIEHAYDLTPDRLDTILRTHVIESDTLRRDDFDAFFVRRSRALLDRIGAAMGKHIADEIRPEDMAEAEQYVEPQEVA